ncbi:MAG: sigma 54-interacting transcriptional regulator [Deltaproteobacteria bacterium]|nr:sigma 54-interacting transcriptional regulator [Deltaproteobacteria bacterium]
MSVRRGRVLRGVATPFVGRSEAIRRLKYDVVRASKRRSPVLLEGSPDPLAQRLVVQALHEASPLERGRLIRVACDKIPPSEFEAAFFGTGDFSGCLEQANEGTLVMEAVDRLTHAQQARLVAFIEDPRVTSPVDGATTLVMVRLIASASDPGSLSAALRSRFASQIHVPLLSERGDDLLPLVRQTLRAIEADVGHRLPRVGPGFMRVVRAYPFPGNETQLYDVVRACTLSGRREGRKRLSATDARQFLPSFPAVEAAFEEALRRAAQQGQRFPTRHSFTAIRPVQDPWGPSSPIEERNHVIDEDRRKRGSRWSVCGRDVVRELERRLVEAGVHEDDPLPDSVYREILLAGSPRLCGLAAELRLAERARLPDEQPEQVALVLQDSVASLNHIHVKLANAVFRPKLIAWSGRKEKRLIKAAAHAALLLLPNQLLINESRLVWLPDWGVVRLSRQACQAHEAFLRKPGSHDRLLCELYERVSDELRYGLERLGDRVREDCGIDATGRVSLAACSLRARFGQRRQARFHG